MTATENIVTEAGRNLRPAEVRVWDPLVRIFHWSLVALFITAWATGDEVKRLHEAAGYAILGLVAFRIVWGLVGAKHARFGDFVPRPSTLTGYLRDMVRCRARRYLGHNPAGGAMTIALLAMLLVIGGTGYMMTTDAFWGIAWVEEAHETAVNLTLGLVGLHVAGVILSSLTHGENLMRSMITGRKRATKPS
jgi:cytochrome b